MTDALVKGYVQQQGASISADGAYNAIRATRDGKLFTASSWKTDYVMRGMAFNVTVGGISAGGDVSLITGGGNGTTIDTDQPELLVQTPTGHYHVPLLFSCATQQDADADTEEGNIILFADLTHTMLASATATAETPQNLLDGAGRSVSDAWSAITADVTDPTCDVLLGYATQQVAQVTAASCAVHRLRLDYNPEFPMFFKGPCAVVAAWGGTSAATGAATYCWAEVPIAQAE